MKTKSVRAKKSKPSRTVRYLLFADRTLQKLSLRRVAAPVKKATKAAKAKKTTSAVRSGRRAHARDSWPPSWVFSRRIALVGATCFVGAAALIGVLDPSHRVDNAMVDAPLATQPSAEMIALPQQEPPREAAVFESKDIIVPKPTTPKPAADTHTVLPSTHIVAPFAEPVKPAPLPSTTEPFVESPKMAAAESTSKALVEDGASVTITGCLQRSDETFWLKDTAGADAPTSRSWKSGFLKKRPARIEVVDAARALKLSNYVGQRVAATGTLVNHEMQTRSVHPVAIACS